MVSIQFAMYFNLEGATLVCLLLLCKDVHGWRYWTNFLYVANLVQSFPSIYFRTSSNV